MKINVRLGWLIAGFVGGILATIWNTIVFLGGLVAGAGFKSDAKKENTYAQSWHKPIEEDVNWLGKELIQLRNRVNILEDEIVNDPNNDEGDAE